MHLNCIVYFEKLDIGKSCIFIISAIAVFVAFFLLFLLVADVIPQGLATMPTFCSYLFANMVLTVVAMVFDKVSYENDDEH